jgi:hypothetical protein
MESLMTTLQEIERDPELKALAEDFCDACEFGSLKAYLEQLDQTLINKLMPYLAAMAREAGLGVH